MSWRCLPTSSCLREPSPTTTVHLSRWSSSIIRAHRSVRLIFLSNCLDCLVCRRPESLAILILLSFPYTFFYHTFLNFFRTLLSSFFLSHSLSLSLILSLSVLQAAYDSCWLRMVDGAFFPTIHHDLLH